MKLILPKHSQEFLKSRYHVKFPAVNTVSYRHSDVAMTQIILGCNASSNTN